MAFRVPTPDVSVIDLTCRLEKPVSTSVVTFLKYTFSANRLLLIKSRLLLKLLPSLLNFLVTLATLKKMLFLQTLLVINGPAFLMLELELLSMTTL